MKKLLPMLIPILLLASASASAETVEVKAKDLTLTVPKEWKQEQPSSSMRAAQFVIAAPEGAKGDADLVVFFFGAGQGGGVEANMKRWTGQFQEAGRKSESSKGKSREGAYHLLSVTGTYNKPVGPLFQRKSTPTAGSQMLALIVETKGGSYYLKLTGPETTVTAARGQLLAAIGAK